MPRSKKQRLIIVDFKTNYGLELMKIKPIHTERAEQALDLLNVTYQNTCFKQYTQITLVGQISELVPMAYKAIAGLAAINIYPLNED